MPHTVDISDAAGYAVIRRIPHPKPGQSPYWIDTGAPDLSPADMERAMRDVADCWAVKAEDAFDEAFEATAVDAERSDHREAV
jgi:hypothetical protein